MKRILTLALLTICLTGMGCKLFRPSVESDDTPDEIPVQKEREPKSGFFRSNRPGTGVDSQAKEIERRLGYN